MKVSTATTAKWCTGQAIPRIDKIQTICNWLCIKKEDLLSENDIKDEEYYLNKDARAYAEFLRDNPGHRVLFDATRKVRAEDRLVSLTPNAISVAFHKAVKSAGLPPFRFHDLRAYSASIRHALGIPTKYIMSDGGWSSPAVLDRVYKRALADKRKEFSKVSNSHFSKLLN